MVYSKQLRFFGYRMHLLTTLEGLIVNFVLALANASDITVDSEVMQNEIDLILIGAKIYSGPPLGEEMGKGGIKIVVLVNEQWYKPLPQKMEKLIKRVRQLIEVVGVSNDSGTPSGKESG